jgi:competence CoiA-like predicted nuclease
MNWKLAFGKECCEIPIIKETKHIADIKTKKNVIIELQNSPIPSTVIRTRETFYGEKMIWIVNGFNFKSNYLNTRFIRIKSTKTKELRFVLI